jgi:hypothetical protein
VSDADLAKSYPALMNATDKYDPAATRKALMGRQHAEGRIVRYAYRPFDVRWTYWDPDTELVDRKRPEFMLNTGIQNRFLTAGERNRMGVFYRPQAISVLGDHHLVESNVSIFPAMVQQDSQNVEANVAKSIKTALENRGLTSDDLFNHIVATLNAPAYEALHMDALRVDWPRIPMPGDDDVFRSSAGLGGRLAALLDAEVEIDGVTRGALLPGLAAIALPFGSDFEATAGWGSIQRKPNGTRLIMPGAGRTIERPWTDQEKAALGEIANRHGVDLDVLLGLVGFTAFDVQLNATSGWQAVPAKAWTYTLGGYPVLKKWLSYRETAVLGRALGGDEVLHFARTARRITEILSMGPALDAVHALAREATADTGSPA